MESAQCLTRPVPNGRRRSGFWLMPENFSVPRGSSRPSLLFFVPYFSSLLDFPSPPLSAPGSPRMEINWDRKGSDRWPHVGQLSWFIRSEFYCFHCREWGCVWSRPVWRWHDSDAWSTHGGRIGTGCGQSTRKRRDYKQTVAWRRHGLRHRLKSMYGLNSQFL